MKFRTPLQHVRGLGSAKQGTHHWWMQRVTAIALAPLAIWFVVEVLSIATQDHAGVVAWIASPVITLFLITFIIALFHHAQLGLQVVVEDYVHKESLKLVTVVLVKLAAFVLGAASVLAVLRIAFVGSVG